MPTKNIILLRSTPFGTKLHSLFIDQSNCISNKTKTEFCQKKQQKLTYHTGHFLMVNTQRLMCIGRNLIIHRRIRILQVITVKDIIIYETIQHVIKI